MSWTVAMHILLLALAVAEVAARQYFQHPAEYVSSPSLTTYFLLASHDFFYPRHPYRSATYLNVSVIL